MQSKKIPIGVWVVLVAGIWLAMGTPGIPTISLPSINSKTTQATYVYSAQHHTIPGPVSAGLQALNKQGIVATTFEVDTKDGTGEVPEQYKVAVSAAKEPPAVVYQAGDKVLRVLKVTKDTTQAEIVEAAQ